MCKEVIRAILRYYSSPSISLAGRKEEREQKKRGRGELSWAS
jgi:hypothetical protein